MTLLMPSTLAGMSADMGSVGSFSLSILGTSPCDLSIMVVTLLPW